MVPAQRDLVTQMGADLADLVLCQNGGCWEDESVLNGVVGGEIAVCAGKFGKRIEIRGRV